MASPALTEGVACRSEAGDWRQQLTNRPSRTPFDLIPCRRRPVFASVRSGQPVPVALGADGWDSTGCATISKEFDRITRVENRCRLPYEVLPQTSSVEN